MSRMRYGHALNIEVQNEIIGLKRQLSIILSENHLLKVKLRRLENELLKKDKHINSYLVNSEKHIKTQNVAYKKTSSSVSKLKKENDELKDLIHKRDLNDQRWLYRIKSNTSSYEQLDSRLRNSPRRSSQHSISPRLESLSDTNALSRHSKQPSLHSSRSVENTDDFLNDQYVTRNEADKFMEMITLLKRQQDVDKDVIRVRNSEITQLSSEVEELKYQLNSERKLSLKRLNDLKHNLHQPKSIKNRSEKKKVVSSTLLQPKSPLPNHKNMLQPVYELNENESSDASGKSDVNLRKKYVNMKNNISIEYSIDSEVSSDGEEIYVVKKNTIDSLNFN